MKILLLIALAGIVSSSVRAQASGSDARSFEWRSGRATLLDVMGAATPKCRARTLDLRTATGGYLTSNMTDPDFVCSGGLITKRKGAVPLSSVSDSDTCGYLMTTGGIVYTKNGIEPQGYDTSRLFLERCPYYPDAYRAFSDVDDGAQICLARGIISSQDYLSWLKKVLYYNPDTNWYCYDVSDMLWAVQSGAADQSILQYIVANHRCPEFDSMWQVELEKSTTGRWLMWLDSVKNKYSYLAVPPKMNLRAYNDSIQADTLAHPFDSTVPTLEQLDLQILMGQQNAVQPASAITSQALLNATLLDNPVQDEIDVSFSMGQTALITMELRDILGHAVPITFAKYQLEQSGTHEARIPAPNLPRGTYYLRITTDTGDVITLKVVKE